MEKLPFDPLMGTLTVKGIAIKLTAKERNLLGLFLKHSNTIVDRNTTLNALWSLNNHYSSRCIDVYIVKLRKLLKHFPNVKLESIHSHGHRLTIN